MIKNFTLKAVAACATMVFGCSLPATAQLKPTAMLPVGKSVVYTPADINRAAGESESQLKTPVPSLSQLKTNSLLTSKKADEVSDWGEWTEGGTFKAEGSVASSLQLYIGEAPEVKTEGIKMYKRMRASDPNVQQFKFEEIIAGQDLILTADAETQIMTSANRIDLGIAISDEYKSYVEEPNENWTLSFGTSRYYETSGIYNLSNIYLMLDNTSGYGGFNLVLRSETIEPLKIYMNYDKIVSEEVESVNVKVNELSDYVKYMRLFKRQGENFNTGDFFYPVPADTLVYTDLDASTGTFAIDVSDGALNDFCYTYMLLLDKSKRPVDGYFTFKIYREENFDKYSWNDLGDATMVELINFNIMKYEEQQKYLDTENGYTFIGEPTTSTVKIQERADLPGFYRLINPFGPTHPNYDKLEVAIPGKDHYVFINATDPSRVYIPNTLLPFYPLEPLNTFRRTKAESPYYTDEEIEKYNSEHYGKIYDRAIITHAHSVGIGNLIVTGFPGMFEMSPINVYLPGYIDYSIDQNNEKTENGVIAVTTSPNVASVDCALVNSKLVKENEYYPENIWKMVTDGKVDGQVVNVPVVNGSASVDGKKLLNQIAEGRKKAPARVIPEEPKVDYTLVMVPRDAQKEAHAGMYASISFGYNKVDLWENHGKITVHDNLVFAPFGLNDLEFDATILRNPQKPNVFCLRQMYQNAQNSNLDYKSSYLGDLFFNATDPERVKILSGPDGEEFEGLEAFDTGITVGNYGKAYIMPGHTAAVAMGREVTDVYYGKRNDLDITFSDVAMYLYLPSFNANQLYGGQGTLSFTMPESCSVDGIIADTDADAPAEYFNLQGQRISHPTPGLYIVRRGNTVTKQLLK